MKLLRDDGSEVEIKENVEYTDRDFRSVLEDDRAPRHEESFGAHGYQEQEFQGGELVDVHGDEDEEDFLGNMEGLGDPGLDGYSDGYDEE